MVASTEQTTPPLQETDSNDPATTTTAAAVGHDFPPCTAEQCNVEEHEKRALSGRTRPSCEMTEKCVNACAAYGRVCPCAARIAAHAACDAVHDLQVDSQLFREAEKPPFLYLNADDIKMGEKLGEGGFSNVNSCTVMAADHPDSGRELAIKYLKRKSMVDLHHFKHGAADLAVEAYFLQTLCHPNIVKLHGITAGSVESNVATGKECGFFIVVDRLYDTLEHRLEVWRKAEAEQAAKSTFITRRSASFQLGKKADLQERCAIALAIAQAMQYLHSLNIIFRDLKPDNIGFDKEDTLKLFDFGLAKELKKPKADGTYELTGHTGSRRYMAPEVAQDLPYNLSVDVYSFGILLWELCSAEKPFYGYSSNKHMQLVVLGGERPKMDPAHTQYWPSALQNLCKLCWHKDPALRPTFDKIIHVLQDKILNPEYSSSPPPSKSFSLDSQASLGLEEAPEEPSPLASDSSPEGPRHQSVFQMLLGQPRRHRSASVGESIFLSFKGVSKPLKEGRARSGGFGSRRNDC